MSSNVVRFDCKKLYAAMEAKRRTLGRHERTHREWSWMTVGEAIGVGNLAALMARLEIGGAPGIDNLVRILEWLGDTDLKPFIIPSTVESTDAEQT